MSALVNRRIAENIAIETIMVERIKWIRTAPGAGVPIDSGNTLAAHIACYSFAATSHIRRPFTFVFLFTFICLQYVHEQRQRRLQYLNFEFYFKVIRFRLYSISLWWTQFPVIKISKVECMPFNVVKKQGRVAVAALSIIANCSIFRRRNETRARAACRCRSLSVVAARSSPLWPRDALLPCRLLKLNLSLPLSSNTMPGQFNVQLRNV